MARPFALSAYLWATSMLEGWAARRLEARRDAGKEDGARLGERFGKAGLARPEGPLVWFHAASVGESLSILELIRRIRSDYPDLNLLVTTGTRTSAQLLGVRLPRGVLHQFVPVDTASAVAGFLDHWRPDLALWTESELWPRLVSETAARGVPMALINGRISQKSARRWRWLGGASKALIGSFSHVLVQDDEIASRFRAIGAAREQVHVTGSLKEGAAPLPADEDLRKALQDAIGHRPVWLAASTHEGEEEAVIEAHKALRSRSRDLLLILAPRHPERGEAVAGLLKAAGLSAVRRSEGGEPAANVSVYLADTLGEMGLWYRLAPISFVGGSLMPVGGHNPFEPAALGSAILHGPHVHNFQDIFDRLTGAGGAVEVADGAALADAVAECLNPQRVAELAAAAWEVSSDGAGVTDRVMALLAPVLDEARGGGSDDARTPGT